MSRFFYLCMLTALLFSINAAAQNPASGGPGRVSGKIIDSATTLAIEYATISLQVAGLQKVITGTTSDTSGRFDLKGIPEGIYQISIEFIGYKLWKTTIEISNKKSDYQLGSVFLHNMATSLDQVTVTGTKKLIDNRIDKMVFNAEADLTGQSGAATDLLKKIPQVSVDPDGNVELAGTGGIRFLINGKPSSAFGSNVADVLQSIPASQIKSIEVITNPGAKYDAQGMGGIINIILKQSKVKGVNGSLALTTGTRVQNGSLNLNMRQGNFGLNAFVSGNSRLPVSTPFTTVRSSYDTATNQLNVLSQDGANKIRRDGVESGLGFDWSLNKYNSLSGNVGYNLFNNTSGGTIFQQQSGSLPDLVKTINRVNSHSDFHSVEASLAYQKKFKQEDQELSVSANTSIGKRKAHADNLQSYIFRDSAYYGIQNVNYGNEAESQISVDYTQPFGDKVVFGGGGRISFDDITSDANVMSLQPVSKTYRYDSAVSNNLDYHQRVYALYAELSFPVSNWFDAKVGTRYERTEINSYYSNAQQQAKNPGYNTLVPSVYLSRKLTDSKTIKLSYSKRIERPDYGDLNPFVNTTDPKNITAGNPYLLPELGKRYELAYNSDLGKSGSFMATLFYRINRNDIQPYLSVYPQLVVGDSVFTNVSVSTRENIGSEKNMGLNLFGDLHPTTKLGIRTNISLFRRYIINGIDPGKNPTSYNYRANINFTYEFTKTLVSEFFGNFNSARNELQGKYPSFTTYSLAIRKQFWNRKGSLALVGTNFFSDYVKQITELKGTNFNTISERRIPFRSIGLNFTWKFGKLEFKKGDEPEENNPLPEAPAG